VSRRYTGAEARALLEARALEAERDALRRQVAELTALGVSLHKAAAAGRDAEREAVVAWLRGMPWPSGVGEAPEVTTAKRALGLMLADVADCIERDEHVAGGEP